MLQMTAATNLPESMAIQTKPLVGNVDDIRAMKRALANAPLGPKATLALTAAIIAMDGEHEADGA
jgi:hypothetical protein